MLKEPNLEKNASLTRKLLDHLTGEADLTGFKNLSGSSMSSRERIGNLMNINTMKLFCIPFSGGNAYSLFRI